ncbi:hypothetical protein MNV49_005109 [Pseudohyphozyma bogoriensis]|nr:hypothetical protein MNV49_005109 [Pseudohyphozyma bogoriensis]
MTFQDLPLDVLVLHLFPLLPPSALINLAASCRAFHDLILGAEGEHVWRQKASKDFKFPTNSTGRRHGWLALYRRLNGSSCWVWGSVLTSDVMLLVVADPSLALAHNLHDYLHYRETGNGRLGLPHDQIRLHRIQGGLPYPTPLATPLPLVELESGGWSFHGLTTHGTVLAWGTMDGEETEFGGTLTKPGTVVSEPIELPAGKDVGEVLQMQVGRKHVVLLNSKGEVWEYRCFGRVYRIQASSIPPSSVSQISAGWSHSLLLTNTGTVHLWYTPPPALLNNLANEAGESSPTFNSRTQGVAFTLPYDDHLLTLPELPHRLTTKNEKIVSLASGDAFVVALTSASKAYFLDLSAIEVAGRHQHGSLEDQMDSPQMSSESRERLQNAFLEGRRTWVSLGDWCEKGGIREGEVTAVSAHFQGFVVYSIPLDPSSLDSRVILGTRYWESEEPTVIPELQGLGVIKVAQGDYHNLALTSSGDVYAWGSFSNGALGLGHPQLIGTPLSAPLGQPESAQAPEPARRTFFMPPMPAQFPGFRNNNQQPIGRTPPPPDRIDKPTKLTFPGDDTSKPEDRPSSTSTSEDPQPEYSTDSLRSSGKFVFQISASGWHSGCLAIDLSPSAADNPSFPTAREVNQGPRADDENPSFEELQFQAGPDGMGRGVRPFRIGFAGRGMRGGVVGAQRARAAVGRGRGRGNGEDPANPDV